MTTPDTRAKELAGLIERLEKAAGQDSELDGLIYSTLEKGPFVRIPAYTASIDAALALVERVLPGHRLELEQSGDGTWWDAAITPFNDSDNRVGETDRGMATPPLAILLALLRALQEPQDAE